MTDQLPEGQRRLDFLDSTSLIVPEDTCRGCLMNELEDRLSPLLDPVYDDGLITVRQDAEWAVPGFMVVAVRPHIGGLDEMDPALLARIFRVASAVRAGMRGTLRLDAVQMYQEDKLDRPHFHLWLLPLWPKVMAQHCVNPRIYESNIIDYLRLFNLAEHRVHLRSCLQALREYLDVHPVGSLPRTGRGLACA